MDGSIKVSAVIPVYNAEGYIGTCIESLQAQTLAELEFVFVDDRGADGSMAAVEAWAEEDPRVRIVRNEENLGEGESRNAGIRAARGDYFCSLDPDDWIAPDFFELLYEEARRSSADAAKGTRVKIDEANGREVLPRSTLNDKIRKALEEGRPLNVSFTYEHQTAIFRRSLFTEETLYGASSNACDTTFLVRMCSQVNSISFVDGAEYYYLQRRDSATGAYTAKRSFAELVSLEEQIDALRNSDNQDAARAYLGKVARSYMGRFSLAFAQGTVTEEVESAYCARLRAIVCTIPGYEELYDGFPEIRALVEDQVLLPPISYETQEAHRAAIIKWTDYLRTLSGTPGSMLVNRYVKLLVSFVATQSPKKRGWGIPLLFVYGQTFKLKQALRLTVAKRVTRQLLTRGARAKR